MFMIQLYYILVVFVVGKGAYLINPKKNACKNFKDYNFMLFNENCFYDADADRTVPQIIAAHGYPLESYIVQTEDGYLLELFRIPYGLCGSEEYTSRQPVFLQHGVFSSSAPWVLNKNSSIGFRLADNGYDVWLGNSRGSTHGKGHVTYSIKDLRYWNFSFHEMAKYDVPSSLDFITKVTGRKDIIFAGQSMGTNLPYAYAALNPEHAKRRLKLIISLAPTIFSGNIVSFLRYLTPFEEFFKRAGELLRIGELLPQNPVLKQIVTKLCLGSTMQLLACREVIYATFGSNSEQSKADIFALFFGHWPAGTSLKNVLHLMQSVKTNKFQQYDYGLKYNKYYYNSCSPPEYNLSSITIPNYIMYGTNDYVSSEQGAIKLHNSLSNRVGIYKLEGFNHLDFFFAKDIETLMFKELFSIFDRFKNTY